MAGWEIPDPNEGFKGKTSEPKWTIPVNHVWLPEDTTSWSMKKYDSSKKLKKMWFLTLKLNRDQVAALPEAKFWQSTDCCFHHGWRNLTKGLKSLVNWLTDQFMEDNTEDISSSL